MSLRIDDPGPLCVNEPRDNQRQVNSDTVRSSQILGLLEV